LLLVLKMVNVLRVCVAAPNTYHDHCSPLACSTATRAAEEQMSGLPSAAIV
jgi:hypothetical protein